MKLARLSIAVAFALYMPFGITSVVTAQAQEVAPHAFVVAIEDVRDDQVFSKQYGPYVPATLQPYGGRYVTRGGKLAALEGELPGRFVIIEFDSLEKALNWYHSPEYQKLKPIREKASKTTLFISEGAAKD